MVKQAGYGIGSSKKRRAAPHAREGQQLAMRDRRRLAQLAVCVVLFGVVLLARGTDRLTVLRTELAQVIRSSADLPAALQELSWSVAHRRAPAETWEILRSRVLLGEKKPAPVTQSDGPFYLSVRRELTGSPSAPPLPGWTAEVSLPEDPMAGSVSRAPSPRAEEPSPEESLPAPEPAVTPMDYSGPALPENTTMDKYALALAETAAPVLGRVTSPFGWREHPIEGGEKFHQGVDLKADLGTQVLAFADGVVDYIGESEIYGQYLQLRHDNGVTSFYAHCSQLLVGQGQRVECGQVVALSGESGRVTGPHLHFELKKDGVRLNPSYYLDLPA